MTLSSSSASSVTASFGLTLQSAVNHIIFLAQENRSLDHYFGALPKYWAADGYVHYKNQAFDGLPQFATPAGVAPTNPGCDPAFPYTPPANTSPDCMWDPAAPVTSFHLQTMCVENPSPSWNESHVDWGFNDPTGINPATLDGCVWTTGHDSRAPVGPAPQVSQFMDTNGVRVMGYYDGNDLNYYYFMASNFATSDRWFSPVMSRTNPNREYLISGSSYGFAYPNGTNSADNFQIPAPIIFEELQSAGITWKVYVHPDPQAATYGTLNCVANDTTPQCLYQISYLHNFTYGQTIINQFPQNIVPISQFYTDAAAGTLPQVAQIEPASNAGLDEHAADFDPTPQNPNPCCSVQAGAAYVKSLIDAVMGTPGNPSPSWKDSVFILTYDEFGGFYDHISPQPAQIPDQFSSPVDLFQGTPPNGDVCVNTGGPTCQFQYTGYRVPLIVVSPFTKQNYVSHSVADYTAILKLIETRFNLSALTNRDAAQIDMSQGTTSFFDFVNEPWKVPPTAPAQNVSGPCYLDHLP
ncbi:MAG: phospholipase C [Terriglobales bacterium]